MPLYRLGKIHTRIRFPPSPTIPPSHRKIPQTVARVREGNYTLSGLTGFEMRGKTVAVLGTGAIGYYAVLILQVVVLVLVGYFVCVLQPVFVQCNCFEARLFSLMLCFTMLSDGLPPMKSSTTRTPH